jgi:hypothetical protein
MTVRQRRTDLFVWLAFQIVGLVVVTELLRGEYALPLVSIAVSAYIASSLASMYVLVVTEFKPVAFETASFVLWTVINAAFAFSIHTSHMPKATNIEEPRERIPVAALRSPDDSVRSLANDRNLRQVEKAWSHLPDKTRKQILNLATPEQKPAQDIE